MEWLIYARAYVWTFYGAFLVIVCMPFSVPTIGFTELMQMEQGHFQWMRLGDWLRSVLCFLQCFDAVGLVASGTSGP